MEEYEHVINAAKESGVQQLFYTSILKADKELGPIAIDHHKTEKLIKASDIPYTIFRNTFYTEFLPMYWEDALETGEWYFPTDGNEMNFARRKDMAEALANSLQTPERHRNKTYEITSTEAYTFEEIADTLSEAIGKEITYHDMPVEAFKKELEDADLPEDVAQLTVAVAQTFVNGGLAFTDEALTNLLGRQPMDTKTYVRKTQG